MFEDLRNTFNQTSLGALVSNFIFLLVALFSLYSAIKTAVWWQSLIFFILVLICGLLINGGYEDIKFTVRELVGMEVTKSQESPTAKEAKDLLDNIDPNDLSELNVNESEGKYQFQFDRE